MNGTLDCQPIFHKRKCKDGGLKHCTVYSHIATERPGYNRDAYLISQCLPAVAPVGIDEMRRLRGVVVP